MATQLVAEAIIRAVDQFSPAVQRMAGTLATTSNRLAEGFQSVGNSAIVLGGVLTGGLALPLHKATEIYADFEAAMIDVRNSFPGTREEFDKLKEGLDEMSLALPVPATRLASLAKAFLDAGGERSTDEILRMTRLAAEMAVAFGIPLDNASQAIGTLLGRLQTMGDGRITGKAKDALEALGMNAIELQAEFKHDWVGAAINLIEALKSLPESGRASTLAELLGVGNPLALRDVVTNLDVIEERLRLLKAGGGPLIPGLDGQFEALNNQMLMLNNTLASLSNVAVSELGPALKDVLITVRDLLKDLRGSPEFVKWLAMAGAAAYVLGPALLGIGLAMTSLRPLFAVVGAGFAALGLGGSTAAAGMLGLAAALAAVAAQMNLPIWRASKEIGEDLRSWWLTGEGESARDALFGREFRDWMGWSERSKKAKREGDDLDLGAAVDPEYERRAAEMKRLADEAMAAKRDADARIAEFMKSAGLAPDGTPLTMPGTGRPAPSTPGTTSELGIIGKAIGEAAGGTLAKDWGKLFHAETPPIGPWDMPRVRHPVDEAALDEYNAEIAKFEELNKRYKEAASSAWADILAETKKLAESSKFKDFRDMAGSATYPFEYTTRGRVRSDYYGRGELPLIRDSGPTEIDVTGKVDAELHGTADVKGKMDVEVILKGFPPGVSYDKRVTGGGVSGKLNVGRSKVGSERF